MSPLRPQTGREPLIVGPRSGLHKQSLILLHGRGSNAARFGPELVSTAIQISPSISSTLSDLLPNARFVFPSATRQRATIYGRKFVTQWFDNWHLTEAHLRTEMMIEGLQKSSTYIQDLIQNETALVGAQNVVLGGLSQGCAASLVTMLLNLGDMPDAGLGVAAFIGMCGWLPFAQQIENELDPRDANVEELGFNPFVSDNINSGTNEDPDQSLLERAVSLLRFKLDIDPPAVNRISDALQPVFLGHGVLDERVPLSLGRQAANCLSELGLDVSQHEYATLGHWYSGEMLRDLVLFLREKVGWDIQLEA